MLRKDVVIAVERGTFHIYPVDNIDEGIELLTGVKAGDLTSRHVYEKGSLNRRVQDRLKSLARKRRAFGSSADDTGDAAKKEDR